MATIIDDAPAPGGAADGGIDRFTLAVSLLLRHRADVRGDATDRLAAAATLLAAAQMMPTTHPATVTMLGVLGAFLDERSLPRAVLDALADGFADRIDEVIAVAALTTGRDLAALHALRCLCRAYTDGVDAAVAADLDRAIGTVPGDYPWLASLKSAAQPMRMRATNPGPPIGPLPPCGIAH